MPEHVSLLFAACGVLAALVLFLSVVALCQRYEIRDLEAEVGAWKRAAQSMRTVMTDLCSLATDDPTGGE